MSLDNTAECSTALVTNTPPLANPAQHNVDDYDAGFYLFTPDKRPALSPLAPEITRVWFDLYGSNFCVAAVDYTVAGVKVRFSCDQLTAAGKEAADNIVRRYLDEGYGA